MYLCKNKNVRILNDLPTKGKGKIDRKSMVGMNLTVDYYGDIHKNIEILEYLNNECHSKFKIKYNNKISEIDIGNMLSGKLRELLRAYPNVIWYTDHWMIDIGVSEEDAKKYASQSNKKIEVICPNCGIRKMKKICKIYREKSINCICGDGFSYPEKFMTNMLTQLDVKFETQYSPEYLIPPKGKRYRKFSDFYIPSLNLIIETDGALGHKGGKTHTKSKKTLEELIEIDKWKDEQYKLHGIETIRINCFESDMEYIKNNILNSKLNELFDLSKIDWVQADLYAIKSNIVKEVCEYWNQKEEWETTTNISKTFNCSNMTIIRYLKQGEGTGWCNYDPKEEMRKVGSNNGKLKAKLIEVFKDGQSFGVFESALKLSENSLSIFNVKFSRSSISKVCNGEQSTHKGYVFKYIT